MTEIPSVASSWAPDFPALLSDCLRQIGSHEFNQSFLALTGRVTGADQCMIFAYLGDEVRCYLSYNTRPKGSARALASQYLKTGRKSDPLIPEIRQLLGSDGIDLIPLDQIRDRMNAEYHETFFDRPGIADKTTLIARRGPLCLGINFYWYSESLSGQDRRQEINSVCWDIIGQVALLHYSDRQPSALRSPLLSLSAREREICELMLKGLTTDAIAWELKIAPSTVTTFRKRAYAKLGLNSKSALFALCN